MKLIDTIGNTPLVELEHIPLNRQVKILCKLEGNNPGGSVKDRAAYGMIKGALDRGDIKPGARLVEATSGNTGIALAMIARLMGLDLTLVMPDNSTRERILTMEAYGAKVILTSAARTIEQPSDDSLNGQLAAIGFNSKMIAYDAVGEDISKVVHASTVMGASVINISWMISGPCLQIF